MCDCERALELISLGLDEALTGDERQELDEHLASCETCRSLSEDLAAIHGSMPELAEEVPEGFCETVMERVRAEKVLPIAPPGRRKKSPWRSWAAMAAVFAVVLVGARTAVHYAGLGGQGSGSAPAAIPEAVPEDPENAAAPEDRPDAAVGRDAENAAPATAGRNGDETSTEDTAEQGPALQKAAVTSVEEPPAPTVAVQADGPVLTSRSSLLPAALETAPVEAQSVPETAPAESGAPERAVTGFAMPGPMMAQVSVDGGESGLPEAVLERCTAYLESGALEHGTEVDTALVSCARLTEEELEQVQAEEGRAESLDLDDLVVTLGDTGGENFVRLVCDSETGEVLGYLPNIKNDP